MSIADKSLTIDVWGGAISLSLIQGESAGRKIYVTIMDEGDPIDLTGREVRLYVVKPDATVVYTNCDIDDAEQGKVSFVVSSQMVAVSGLGSGEFHVIDADGALLKTPKIGIVIQPSLDVDGAIESSNEYSVLVDLINANASLSRGTLVAIIRKIFNEVMQDENASLSRGTLVATTAAGMTQTDCIYVYTGSETGYTAGNWYYYNGSAWVSGGVYFSATIDGTIITDTDNSTSYRMQFRLVGGKPVIEYNQV